MGWFLYDGDHCHEIVNDQCSYHMETSQLTDQLTGFY